MRPITCVLAAVAVALAAAPAGAASVTQPDGSPVDPAVQAVIAASREPVPSGPVTLHVNVDCPLAGGGDCTGLNGRDVWIQLPEAGQPMDEQSRIELMHELGHVADLTRFHVRAHRLLERAMHRRGPWWGASGDENPPIEQFAVAYSFCATGAPVRLLRVYDYYGYEPTRPQLRTVCALTRRLLTH